MDAEDRVRLWVMVFAAGVAISVGCTFGFIVFRAATSEVVAPIVQAHFAAVVMAPLIAMTALLVVVIFRASSGPVEFDAVGFKFSGASGQTVMWIACVLVMTVATRLLWM